MYLSVSQFYSILFIFKNILESLVWPIARIIEFLWMGRPNYLNYAYKKYFPSDFFKNYVKQKLSPLTFPQYSYYENSASKKSHCTQNHNHLIKQIH